MAIVVNFILDIIQIVGVCVDCLFLNFVEMIVLSKYGGTDVEAKQDMDMDKYQR